MDGLMLDMLRDVSERGIDRSQVLKALRALSCWYGGQLIYLPRRKEKSEFADELYGVIADAIGDADAQPLYDIMSTVYGGAQWYARGRKSCVRQFQRSSARSTFARRKRVIKYFAEHD